jgi:hypothetical protein
MRTVSQGVLRIGEKNNTGEKTKFGKFEVEIKFHRVIFCAFSIFSFFFFEIVCTKKKNNTHISSVCFILLSLWNLEDFGWLVFVSLLIGACYHRQITTTKREEIKNRR